MTLSVGDRAPEVVFGGPDGDIALADLHTDRPVVVAFLRHFG